MDDSERDELAAVSEVLRGNAQAFRLIVREYQDSVLRICRSYLKDPEEAEDAVQDIFLKVFKSLGTFKLEKRFRPWFYTITFNHLKFRYGRIMNFRKFTEIYGRFARIDREDCNASARRASES